MNHPILKHITSALLFSLVSLSASAQAMFFSSAKTADPLPVAGRADRDTVPRSIDEIDTWLAASDTVDVPDSPVCTTLLPDVFFVPAVYTRFEFADTARYTDRDYSGNPALRWIEEQDALQTKMNRMRRALFFSQPQYVKYNINLLPEAPKEYHAVVNPEDHTIEIHEVVSRPMAPTFEAPQVQKRHWIRTFDASLQFSQAYVSPNWYQGGNNNLNMLANVYYNVKLNQEYHPKLLFETTAQYKLGMNSAPDDTIHNYSISEDVLQVTSTFGLKAAKRWYYSLTGNFKTQLLNSYDSNSRTLRSAFLSPAELTVGLGMTYNYANEKKTLTFDASLAPLSYNLKTCTNSRIDPTWYSIPEGRKYLNSFGSSAELKLFWQLTYNIAYTSRMFGFTDYDSAQADWEHTLAFSINRFLSAQIFCHIRYDSSTPPCDDIKWKKLQIKEILSIGFVYKFSSI